MGKLAEEYVLLLFIDRLHCLEDLHPLTMLMRRADESLDILGEAGAPVATPCIEELAADAGITAHPSAYHRYIGSYGLT